MTTLFFGKLLVLCAQNIVTPTAEHTIHIELHDFMSSMESRLSKQTSVMDTTDYISFFRQIDSTKTYNQSKADVQKVKAKIDLDLIGKDSLSKVFTDLLMRKIIPYWYGTRWAFEGYTAIPRQGEIACGYFVSTTLLHMGLTINRYKLAQQLPIHEAMTLSIGVPLIEINNPTIEENIAQLKDTLSDGIYFLGFDGSHVGYILERNGNLFVVHANYIGDGGVAVEKIEESQAFAGYRRFYIAEISTNERLMKKWILNETVTVVEGD